MIYRIEAYSYDPITNEKIETSYVSSKTLDNIKLVPSMFFGNAIFTDDYYVAQENPFVVRQVTHGQLEVERIKEEAQKLFPEYRFHIVREARSGN